MEITHVLVADGAELVRFGLEKLINREEDLSCEQTFGDFKSLHTQLKNQTPETPLILIDFTIPGFSIESIVGLKQLAPHARIVAITPDQNSHTIVLALKAGVKSYIKKDCDIHEILDAIRATSRGDAFFCGKILETIEGEDINPSKIEVDPLSCAPISLSKREIEIISHIAEGLTNPQIAEKLNLSAHTIGTHRKNIMTKLGVKNTAAIVMYAIKAQLVSPNKYLFSELKD